MTSFTVAIDWDKDGSFATAGDNIIDYVDSAEFQTGLPGGLLQRTAYAGRCLLVLNNEDKRFSPENTGGPYDGKLVLNRPMRIQVTYNGTTKTLFRGVIQKIIPQAGQTGPRQCLIECADQIGVLQDYMLSLPLQENQRADVVLTKVLAAAFNGDAATGTITFSGAAANNDTITVNGTVYTFKTTLTPTAGEVMCGADENESARNLSAAINNAEGAVKDYYADGTERPDDCTGAVDGAVVTINANARGAWGNALTLEKSCANATLSGATLAGGTDAPAGLLDIDTANETFSLAGDTWSDEITNALSAVNEIVQSEYGLFLAARDGTLTFKSRDWWFKLPSVAVSQTFNGSHTEQQGELSLDDLKNRVVVSYRPRSELALGVVARAGSVISVPGMSGGDRWNPGSGLKASDTGAPAAMGDMQVYRLPYVQRDAGEIIGAKDLITPVPGTDYTVNDREDGTGYDYTYDPALTLSIAAAGSGVGVTAKNTATGILFIINLQVRGVAIIAYEPQTAATEDITSIAAYGKRSLSWYVPMEISAAFASSLAGYLLGRHKDPYYRVQSIRFDSKEQADAGAGYIWALEFGNTVTISEYQTAVSAQKFMIAGQRGLLTNGGKAWEIEYYLTRVDDMTYWILGDATYGKLGDTTRLAV